MEKNNKNEQQSPTLKRDYTEKELLELMKGYASDIEAHLFDIKEILKRIDSNLLLQVSSL